MKIFVFEFITGGGYAGETLPAGLVREGDLMVRAIIRDLVDAGCRELITLRDPRLEDLPEDVTCRAPRGAILDDCRHLLAEVDAAILIAPETDDILYELTRLAGECGCRLLGSDLHTVSLCSSKRRCNAYLQQHDIPVPISFMMGANEVLPAQALVVKPDDGVGAEDCFHFDDPGQLQEWLATHGGDYDWIVEEFVPGDAASLSLFCADGRAELLSVNRQCVNLVDNRIVFEGVRVNDLAGKKDAVTDLVRKLGNILPGLRGFVGVDLVYTENGPVVIEINPRLTTSYAGLREALGYNPAELYFKSLDAIPNDYSNGQSVHINLVRQ